MQLDRPRTPLRMVEMAWPECGPRQVLVEVAACGVCRTDLHVVDGDIDGTLPIVPGHEIVGHVVERGADAVWNRGQRVGIPWLARSCGRCRYCRDGRENLCDAAQFTGFTRPGGFATHVLAEADFCFALPDHLDDVHAAPLLCAGLIGYRALAMAGDAGRVGIYGFGAAAHIICQIMVAQGREVFAFTRPGDAEAQDFALSLGCRWAGRSDVVSPRELDAALLFAPIGGLVPLALRSVRKGGTVVCAGIHMSDIPAFPYALLWEERVLKSVANLTRADGRAFFELLQSCPVETEVEIFKLAEADAALAQLREGRVRGAAVLCP